MIEIGKERTLTRGTRKAASTMELVAGILVLSWLVRSILGISQYSETLLLMALGFGLLGDLLKTNLSRGHVRAASSLLGNIAFWSLTTIILILFLGWIAGLQSDTLPAIFYSNVPNLAIATIFFGLASVIIGQFSPLVKGLRATGPPIFLGQAATVDMGETKLSTKVDSIGLPVRKPRKTVGCVVTGDLNAVFETPMGTVNARIAGPATTFGVPFRGTKATGEQVTRVTGKRLNDLIGETQVETTMVGETEIEVDLPPFVHFDRDQFQESVDVGPVSVKRGPRGQTIKIGPISIDADEDSEKWFSRRYWGKHGRFSTWWSVKGMRDTSYISSSGDTVKAKWNGSSLELGHGSMKLKVGSDGFTYSPQELETYTPLHTLKVTQDKVTLNTKTFTLDIVGSRVILRAEDGSKSTDSSPLARDLRALLADTAKKQVSDVLEGLPIELDEMLGGTEELLKKYA
ncbi:MAG: hypothetical protein HY296_04450 [Thaumarchaeota archaeon]|nr:hypothetical protein [Nitrososphaerota archaeon]